MESSRRDLLIDMVVDRFIFKNNQITPSHCFTFVPKTGVGLPKKGVIFYCVSLTLLIFQASRRSGQMRYASLHYRPEQLLA